VNDRNGKDGSYALVGCGVFKPELEYLRPRLRSGIDLYWLPQRLHNKPLDLRRLIQEQIDLIDRTGKPYRAVLLLYGLCSKGVVGVSSRRYPLVIPRAQDCITLLLGSRRRYAEHFREKPGTYWFTKGWIDTGFTPGVKSRYEGVFDPYEEKYRSYRRQFDEQTARYLIQEWDQRWIGNYTTLAYVDWGMEGSEQLREFARRNASGLGLEFEELKGDPSLMLRLLNGEWDEEDFLQVPPGRKVLASYREDVLACSAGPADGGAAVKGEPAAERRGEPGGKGGRRGIGLGIDAGGTYTDTVLYDFASGRVVGWAKAPTTHERYEKGIAASLDVLLERAAPESVSGVTLVSLSTILATNAIVEGKGGRAGLILAGYDRHALKKLSLQPLVNVRGRHSIAGELVEPLDLEEAEAAVETLLDKGVDVIAVSSQVGPRNPEHELMIRELIARRCGLPVILGSELTDELNCVKRANTCFFNARLVPLVTDLLESVKSSLRKRGITAPVMVVKGDGTLMSERVARNRPIEMVLSGPAASVMGGAYLSGVRTCYVVDMGGTTTDMAVVEGGAVAFKEEGISIEGFRTAVRTVDVHTFGLGGDSYIRYNRRDGSVQVGPRRVIPISFLAHAHPEVNRELARAPDEGGDGVLVQPADFFLFQKDSVISDLHPQERAILKALKRGPRSRRALAELAGASGLSLLRTERLETHGNILRCGLTPTDLLHLEGRVDLWDREAARAAAALYARRAGLAVEELSRRAMDEFYRSLLRHLLAFTFRDEEGMEGGEQVARSLSGHLFSEGRHFRIGVRLHRPFVFIGAPAHAYAESLGRYVNIDLRVPRYNEVANAVGAISGGVRESVTILIRPAEDGGYVAYTPTATRRFDSLDAARKEMSALAGELAAERARLSGAGTVEPQVKVEDKTVDLSDEDVVYLETVITATVSSVPAMK
jgi:N-methylhydantoinase A/oxoprolinase/acetone carboxylase beta subunit